MAIVPRRASCAWSPPVDVGETDDAYVIEAELPSVEREDANVELAGNDVQITGAMKEREHTGTLRRRMRRTGRFAYRVTLPRKGDADKIEASLADGVLTVRIPNAADGSRSSRDIQTRVRTSAPGRGASVTTRAMRARGLRARTARVWLSLGPALVAAVACVDPSNFATNTQAGSETGYRPV